NQLFVPFLAYSLTSSKRERIQMSLQLLSISISLAEFPLTLLGENITANNSLKCEEIEALRHPIEYRQSVSLPRLNCTSSGNRQHWQPPQTSEKQVETLIEKMKTGMDLKDTRASEIMGIYEHKLTTLETKESHLQDLLEAKALALSQADRLIAQYRCRRAQADAEARKMRLLLQESENRIEEYIEERNDSLLQKEQLQQDDVFVPLSLIHI
ncbi:protein CIP2A homolog, partial [Anneissia japonica]|uniref:protein CIP2A homolog n=1 Tax=Anneissia japonica TaxID=1529436 RepID=UPI0014256468